MRWTEKKAHQSVCSALNYYYDFSSASSSTLVAAVEKKTQLEDRIEFRKK